MLVCSYAGDVGVVGCTAALMVLERLVMVVTESAFLRPVLIALLAGSNVYAPIAQQVRHAHAPLQSPLLFSHA